MALQVDTAGETACTLLFQGEPYWYGEKGASFAWNWLDLLQFLVTNWSALMLEEALPIDTGSVDAIACWGTIQPLILLNSDPESRAKTDNGRRATLAHELCHLLVDRYTAYPMAEVLGGESDAIAERRANAFAAELLLPQNHVKNVCSGSADVHQVLTELCQSHHVGKQLAAWQVLNSGISLTEDEMIRLRQIGERNSARDMDGFGDAIRCI